MRSWIIYPAISLIMSAITMSTPAAAQDRYAAVVIEAVSGEILYADRADERRFPASLAKMMTLYLLFDAIERGEVDPNENLPVSATAAGRPRSSLGLRQGDQISVEDAILALVVWSANDVATVVAERLAGSEDRFADLMTARARALGLAHTNFANASGLSDPEHATTALDMALLARALWADFPDYYCYFQAPDFTWANVQMRNHNHLLSEISGVDGIKTGYTSSSGFNIATSAERSGRRLIVVVMGGETAEDRDAQAASLIEAGFNAYTPRPDTLPFSTPVSMTTTDIR